VKPSASGAGCCAAANAAEARKTAGNKARRVMDANVMDEGGD
jgi:hypothetical protein